LNQLLDEYDHDLKTVIQMFSSRRIQDAEAISDLAFYNYIEVIIYFFFNAPLKIPIEYFALSPIHTFWIFKHIVNIYPHLIFVISFYSKTHINYRK